MSAPATDIAIAALNTMIRPWWNGPEIRCGKNCFPVSTAVLRAGSRLSTPDGPSRLRIGLYPSNAENSVLTGGRWATCEATLSGTPCARSPLVRVRGSVAARPAIISEKKMPIDRDMPEFWNVERMTEAAPRSQGGTLFMMAEVLGEANRPEPTPLQKMMIANSQNGKLTGSSISPVNASAASSSPAVANGRGPYRSDKVPEMGPAIRNPAVSGSM